MIAIHPAAAAMLAVLLAGTLGACGDTRNASSDATADTVEVPADEAMSDVPMPVETSAADDTPAAVPPVPRVEQDAQQAADDAQSAVDDAVAAAEDSMEDTPAR